MKNLFSAIIITLLTSHLLSSCEVLMFAEGAELTIGEEVASAAVERTAFMRELGVAERIGVSETTAALVIENEPVFFSQL